jgi:16S rRNA (cytidine1402-2'-O)-methyltransferase
MLYVVATPIGNLGDVTLRALEILKSVDLVAAEDTRHSGMLLKHLGIKKPFVSYHQHNEAMRTAELVVRLADGENIALITDAGTPGLSDPGARLVRECIKRGLSFTIVPGPSSILIALVGSGFSLEKFCFRGFLPIKSGQREREGAEGSNGLRHRGSPSSGVPPGMRAVCPGDERTGRTVPQVRRRGRGRRR